MRACVGFGFTGLHLMATVAYFYVSVADFIVATAIKNLSLKKDLILGLSQTYNLTKNFLILRILCLNQICQKTHCESPIRSVCLHLKLHRQTVLYSVNNKLCTDPFSDNFII